MSCPTCGHTMQATGCKVTDLPFFWCPRCGTFKRCQGEVAVPGLVHHARVFRESMRGGEDRIFPLAQLWRQAGMEESIDLPENRSQL